MKYLSPTGFLEIRGSDRWARSGGHFGASRDHSRIGKPDDDHKGSDLVIASGKQIIAPGDGVWHRTGICYPGDYRYLKCVFDLDGGVRMNLLYVWPRLVKGKRFARGEVIGFAQDLTARYECIINHVHAEVVVNGRRVDPLLYLVAA